MKKKELTPAQDIKRDLEADWAYDVNETPAPCIWYC